MELSAPVYVLKRKARLLARQQGIPLNIALDRIASEEGCPNWSLLAARLATASPAVRLHAHLRPGDLLLLGARPGHGKTLLGLEVAVEAMKSGSHAVFFSLEYTATDMLARFRDIGAEPSHFESQFTFDGSDDICADYIMRVLSTARLGTLVVIDYLQLLDQRRTNAELGVQVAALRAFARAHGLIVVFLSQIDRSFDPARKRIPDMKDVRLPNRMDLTLFDKTCFLNEGQVRLGIAA